MPKKLCLASLISGLVLVVIFIPIYILNIVLQDFQVKSFLDYIEIPYNTEFETNPGQVCFGNKDRCQEVNITTTGEVDTSKLGEYKITYTYKYKTKTLVKDQTIKVIDNIAPIISLETDNFNVCPQQENITLPVKAQDDYDGDITDKVEQYVTDNIIHFKVSDSSGNTTELTQELDFSDDEKPTLKLNGSSTMYLRLNETYREQGAKAYDNCAGDISNKIVIKGDVNTKKTGEYKITYSVTDNASNTQSLTRTIYVYDTNNNSNAAGYKEIYLTFDDGPGPYTAKLLDILKKYNVKATFFVTNQSITKGYDNLILRAYQEGHTIGLHTNTHNYNIYRSVDAYFDDLYAIQEKVKRITGYTSTIIRFPGGSSNTVSRSYDNGSKIMSTLTRAVEAKGFKYFDWNISSGDAGNTTSTSQVFKNIVSNLGTGSYIVLQHDIKGFSVNAVEDVIQYALAKGYSFKPLTMDSYAVHHHINN